MIENGGPIIPGKEKNIGDQKKLEVLSISEILMKDKMNYQDLPMLCILVLALLTTILSGGPFDLVCVCFIGITALSLSCNYLSLKTQRDQKGVDKNTVVSLIRDRMEVAT